MPRHAVEPDPDIANANPVFLKNPAAPCPALNAGYNHIKVQVA
jgi:hypothetical protein